MKLKTGAGYKLLAVRARLEVQSLLLKLVACFHRALRGRAKNTSRPNVFVVVTRPEFVWVRLSGEAKLKFAKREQKGPDAVNECAT